MAITAARMVEILKERDVEVRKHPSGTGWLPTTSRGERLGGPRRDPYLTPEEAVEAAEQGYIEADIRKAEASAARLFDVLELGRFHQKSRKETIVIDGVSTEITVWDIIDSITGVVIVTGERSLRAAVIAAESQQPIRGGGGVGGRA